MNKYKINSQLYASQSDFTLNSIIINMPQLYYILNKIVYFIDL
jgi:hypothetical protein